MKIFKAIFAVVLGIAIFLLLNSCFGWYDFSKDTEETTETTTAITNTFAVSDESEPQFSITEKDYPIILTYENNILSWDIINDAIGKIDVYFGFFSDIPLSELLANMPYTLGSFVVEENPVYISYIKNNLNLLGWAENPRVFTFFDLSELGLSNDVFFVCLSESFYSYLSVPLCTFYFSNVAYNLDTYCCEFEFIDFFGVSDTFFICYDNFDSFYYPEYPAVLPSGVTFNNWQYVNYDGAMAYYKATYNIDEDVLFNGGFAEENGSIFLNFNMSMPLTYKEEFYLNGVLKYNNSSILNSVNHDLGNFVRANGYGDYAFKVSIYLDTVFICEKEYTYTQGHYDVRNVYISGLNLIVPNWNGVENITVRFLTSQPKSTYNFTVAEADKDFHISKLTGIFDLTNIFEHRQLVRGVNLMKGDGIVYNVPYGSGNYCLAVYADLNYYSWVDTFLWKDWECAYYSYTDINVFYISYDKERSTVATLGIDYWNKITDITMSQLLKEDIYPLDDDLVKYFNSIKLSTPYILYYKSDTPIIEFGFMQGGLAYDEYAYSVQVRLKNGSTRVYQFGRPETEYPTVVYWGTKKINYTLSIGLTISTSQVKNLDSDVVSIISIQIVGRKDGYINSDVLYLSEWIEGLPALPTPKILKYSNNALTWAKVENAASYIITYFQNGVIRTKIVTSDSVGYVRGSNFIKDWFGGANHLGDHVQYIISIQVTSNDYSKYRDSEVLMIEGNYTMTDSGGNDVNTELEDNTGMFDKIGDGIVDKIGGGLDGVLDKMSNSLNDFFGNSLNGLVGSLFEGSIFDNSNILSILFIAVIFVALIVVIKVIFGKK